MLLVVLIDGMRRQWSENNVRKHVREERTPHAITCCLPPVLTYTLGHGIQFHRVNKKLKNLTVNYVVHCVHLLTLEYKCRSPLEMEWCQALVLIPDKPTISYNVTLVPDGILSVCAYGPVFAQ